MHVILRTIRLIDTSGTTVCRDSTRMALMWRGNSFRSKSLEGCEVKERRERRITWKVSGTDDELLERHSDEGDPR